ncbi:MAG: hypothetical protein H5T86_06975 [Armatimonadetes bacterium]|nr:hypothetical protein [Armatimonadota bacterium]
MRCGDVISRIRGKLIRVSTHACEVEANGLCYEVLLPPTVAERLAERTEGAEVELYTYYYLQTEGQRIVPQLLGFETEYQRDFFALLVQVPKLGPKAALRAMALPVRTLAEAIRAGDTKLLRSLPGVGPQRAKDIVSQLEDKVDRFLQVPETTEVAVSLPRSEAEADAVDVLEQLGMTRAEALRLVSRVRLQHPEAQTVDEIVRLVFRER